MVTELRSIAETERSARTGPGRLLLLSTDMGMGGGAEEQVIRLAYAFQDRGWAVWIVSLLPPSPMPADFSGRGIPLVHLGMRRGSPDPRALYRLARLLAEFRPDVVHSHMVHANLLARGVRLIRRFPVLICTLHNVVMSGVERDHAATFELAHRWTDRLADRTTAICQSAAEGCVAKKVAPLAKMEVVPNGIDSRLFRPDPAARDRLRRALGLEGRFVWLAAGRLELAKAYPTMLRALARLGAGPRTLLICGQGSLDAELRTLAETLGVGDGVRFLGLRADLPSLLSAADAFALSSDLEGLPLVLLQASAAALPIVATDVGGNAELVDRSNGQLVPAGDPGAFAQAMAEIEALSGDDRSALGRAGQQRVLDRYEAERVMDHWERLYGSLLAKAASRRRGNAHVS